MRNDLQGLFNGAFAGHLAVILKYDNCKAVASGKIKKGDRIMVFGFGGGLTYAGNVIQWA